MPQCSVSQTHKLDRLEKVIKVGNVILVWLRCFCCCDCHFMFLISIICTLVRASTHIDTNTTANMIIKWREMARKELKSRVVRNYYSLEYIFALFFNSAMCVCMYSLATIHLPGNQQLRTFLNCEFFTRLHAETQRPKDTNKNTRKKKKQ